MTNPYIIALRASGRSDERYWITREKNRYLVAGRRFREAGIDGFADLFDGYAEQARLELEALDRVEQRIGALDAKLFGADDAEVTASAVAFGGPLPRSGEAA